MTNFDRALRVLEAAHYRRTAPDWEAYLDHLERNHQ